ncbi:MAG: CPBP family glutamic-type intramembrane protease [Armatimonadota bacterium]|nr:CPBP family glutamic-type intramembrane protease [Armatimonadota bacterium]
MQPTPTRPAAAPPPAVAPLVGVATGLGVLALATRPATPAGIALVSVLAGACGLLGPLPARRGARPPGTWLAATGVGLVAVAAARLAAGPPAGSYAAAAVAAALVAAVAEEAFFRRLLYGWLEPLGPIAAIGLAAIAFAAVHVPAWGPAALPVDLAAGVLFGWQRWASGTWTAPAATHVAANLLQVIA